MSDGSRMITRAGFIFALLLLLACRGAGSEGMHIGTEQVEAVSLMGDTLVRPVVPPASRVGMERQLADAKAARAAQPNDPDALIWVGRRMAYLGRYNDAIQVFSEGVRRFPNDSRMYRHRGHRYITIRRFDDAIVDFETAGRLMTGQPDQVEPDGQPNSRGIPIGSLQSNVWYHLALAHYLKGDWNDAARAARSGILISSNPDRLVSQTHWLYMALRRAARDSAAAAALVPIQDDFDIIENDSYYRLLKLYKTGVPLALLDSAIHGRLDSAGELSLAYGLANWFLYTGDTTRALEAFKRILESDQWASFGYIAAEADLARMRKIR